MIDKNTRMAVWLKSGGRCAYCGCEIPFRARWHVEHVIPKSRNGENSLSNYEVSCVNCNSKKSDLTPEEFKQYISDQILDQLFNLFYKGYFSFVSYKYLDHEILLDLIVDIENLFHKYFEAENIKFDFEKRNDNEEKDLH